MKRCPHQGCPGSLRHKDSRSAVRCGFPVVEVILECSASPHHNRLLWKIEMGATRREFAGDGLRLRRRAVASRRALRVEAVEHPEGMLLRTVE